jgi:hypothetical protein
MSNTGEQVPEELLPLLVSPEWVDERKKRWGVTSPIYTSTVLGEFPDICDDTLVMPKWIEAAQARTLKRNGRPVLAWDNAPASVRTRPWACGERAAGYGCTGRTPRPTR